MYLCGCVFAVCTNSLYLMISVTMFSRLMTSRKKTRLINWNMSITSTPFLRLSRTQALNIKRQTNTYCECTRKRLKVNMRFKHFVRRFFNVTFRLFVQHPSITCATCLTSSLSGFFLVFPYPFSQQTNRSEQFLFRVPNRMFDASKNIYFNFNHKPAVNLFLPVTFCSSFHWTFNFQTYSHTHRHTFVVVYFWNEIIIPKMVRKKSQILAPKFHIQSPFGVAFGFVQLT